MPNPNLKNLIVLDVGGTSKIWIILREHYNLEPKKVILLNNNPVHLSLNSSYTSSDKNYEIVVGDACKIPFSESSFNLVFSNSVIETCRGDRGQRKICKGMSKSGRKNIYTNS